MVIHSCGFESIPPDIGVYCAVNQLNEPNSDVSYFIESNGNISGGTWASLINSLSSPQPIIDRRKSNPKKITSAQPITLSHKYGNLMYSNLRTS